MTDGHQPPPTGAQGARPRQTFDPNAADPEIARLAQQPLAELPPELQAEPPAPSREPHPYELPYQGRPQSPQDPQISAAQSFGAPQGQAPGGYGQQQAVPGAQQGQYAQQAPAAQQYPQTLGIDGQPLEPVAPQQGGRFGSPPPQAAPAGAQQGFAAQPQQGFAAQPPQQASQDFSVGGQFVAGQQQFGAGQQQFGAPCGGRVGSPVVAPTSSHFDDGSENVKRGWGAVAAGVGGLIVAGFALSRGVGLFAFGTLLGTIGLALYAIVNGHRTEKHARENFTAGRGQGIAAAVLGYLAMVSAAAVLIMILLTWLAVITFVGAVSGGDVEFVAEDAPDDIATVPLVAASTLAVGDCVYDPFDTSVAHGFDGGQEFQVVDCSVPHGGEVVYVGQGSGSDPDDAWAAANETCIAQFEEYVRSDYFQSDLWVTAYLPGAASWTAGERAFVCVASPFSGYETGSVEGSGR